MMEHKDYQRLLEFSDQWLWLGLLTEDKLRTLGQEYEAGDDKATEHYRMRVFNEYLGSHRPLSPQVIEALYDLGWTDPDPTMGGWMIRVLVDLEECPPGVLERASASGQNHLVKAVWWRRMREEMRSGVTEELFARCLKSGDSVVQRGLLERPELTRSQLEQLTKAGATRAVRNLARERLRGRRYAA
jgi:hypothetical protein